MSSSGNPSSSSGSCGGGGPCGACKFLRWKCVTGCIFPPYFDSEQGAAHFAAVHKVFGASNVSKLLLHVPEHKRPDTVVSICFEAQARLRYPIYGCVSHIVSLQKQVVSVKTELSYLQANLATLEMPQPQPPVVPVTSPSSPPPLSMWDLPTINIAVRVRSFLHLRAGHVLHVGNSGTTTTVQSSLRRPVIIQYRSYKHWPVSFFTEGKCQLRSSPGTSGSASTVIKRQ